jgi:hypothetical protein
MSEKKKVDWAEARQERRKLKQQLFKIRRKLEGADITLTEEQLALKAKYEKMRGFTSWHDFPEHWDIGDPNEVKRGSPCFNDIDRNNLEKILGKPYDYIVHLDKDYSKE